MSLVPSITDIASTVSLASFCFASDYFAIRLSSRGGGLTVRAVTDSAIHFTIGAWCWSLARGTISRYIALEILLCGLLSSAIDIDHIISAHSFELKHILNLKHQSFFHAFVSIPFACLILWLLSILLWLLIEKKGWDSRFESYKNLVVYSPNILFVAWFSHQLRDSTRRGLWFWPFGHTIPVPYWIYISVIILTPYLIRI